jgi:hypothetical protein
MARKSSTISKKRPLVPVKIFHRPIKGSVVSWQTFRPQNTQVVTKKSRQQIKTEFYTNLLKKN